MSLATPSAALVAPGPRARGAAIVLLCVGGFLLGQVVAIITTTVAIELSGTALSYHRLATMDEPPWWFIVSTLLGLWIGWSVSISLIQARYRVIEVRSAFRFEWTDLWMIPLAPAFQIAFALVYGALHVTNTSKPAHHILGTAAGAPLVLLCALTIVVVPAVEEMFFRATLLPGLRDLVRTGSVYVTAVAAIVIDGVVFALAHAEWVQLPALAIVGMFLAWLYWHYGRLWPNYIFHASFNAVGIFSALYSSH